MTGSKRKLDQVKRIEEMKTVVLGLVEFTPPVVEDFMGGAMAMHSHVCRPLWGMATSSIKSWHYPDIITASVLFKCT